MMKNNQRKVMGALLVIIGILTCFACITFCDYIPLPENVESIKPSDVPFNSFYLLGILSLVIGTVVYRYDKIGPHTLGGGSYAIKER